MGLSLELDSMGRKAAHISPHILCPSVAGSNFLRLRGPDGSMGLDARLTDMLKKAGTLTPEDVADGLAAGLAEDKHYIVLDHALDIPSTGQITTRLEDQVQGRRPRRPEQLGMMLALHDREAFAERKALMQ